MFKGRSQFQAPQVQGYTRPKNDIKNDMKNEQSLQKHKPEIKTEKYTSQEVKSVAVPSVDHKFNISLSEPSTTDPFLFWTHNLTSQVSGEYARKLIMRAQQWFVRDIQGTDIVGKVQIGIDNIPGFYNADSIETNVVGTLFLTQISQNIDDVGIRSYNLVYQQSQDIFWDIPMNTTSLKLRVSVDGVPTNFKFDQPLNLQFDIRHMGK